MAPITVLFTHKSIRGCNSIFSQPLFYLATTITQKLKKIDTYDADIGFSFQGVDAVSDANQPLKLEIGSARLTPGEFSVNYIMKRFNNAFKFTYKGCEFMIQTSNETGMYPVSYGMREVDIAVSYEMTYDSADFSIFEEFIQTSVKFFKKNYDDTKINKDKLKMFISSCDGSYFDNLGNRNKRDVDTVYLPKTQKKAIIDDIANFLNPSTIADYKLLGITHKRVYMLEGKPGTGKTSLVTALASHFKFNIAIVSFTPKMTDIDLIRALRSVNDDKDDPDDDKCFVLFEDMDCIFKERKSHDESKNLLTFSGLLNALDGTSTPENQIYFITTNHMNNLDSALIRPGRVDFFMHFDNAIKEQIDSIYQNFTKADKIQTDKFYDELVYLNIKVTTSLLQQYLLKYMKKPDEAIENLGELKKMFDVCNISPREAGETGLYS